jgi:hypothetical protein
MDDKSRIKLLEEELEGVKAELQKTKEHLKKYTAPSRNRKYYENNKDAINERHKKYKYTTEQRRESNRRTYLKRKEKLKKELEEKTEC